MRIGFLGTGHIAAPLARALARDGHAVSVSDRNAKTAADLVSSNLGILAEPNQTVLDASDIVFLTLRPAIWAEVASPLAWRPDHQIVSAMAGVTIAQITTACAPVTDVSVTLPLGHIETGGCPLPTHPTKSPVTTLFGTSNPIIPLAEEADLTAYFAASSLLTAALTTLIATSDWLAAETGAKGDAEAYAKGLAASYLMSLPGTMAEARAGLATPNTLNQAMLDALTNINTEPTIHAALTKMTAAMRSRP
ncbi:MAG: NAD(P)-binding domain-containing protein [Pseudomonadota bacterium]